MRDDAFDEYPIRTILLHDYPFMLKDVPRPPKKLQIRGTVPGPEYRFLCVVGSRKATDYGRRMCRKLISFLSGHRICIVSGMAIGIDSAAHEAALEAGLKTIAFPGSGLNPGVIYPRSKMDLSKRILKHGGALISPFEENQGSAEWTFPVRNELMAGSAHATLIIEACRGSGTLLTAEYANNFNRDTLAVPGDIDQDRAYGPNMLIRTNKAVIVTRGEDILQYLGLDYHSMSGARASCTYGDLSSEEKKIMEELHREPASSSILSERTGMSISTLNVILGKLELLGCIREIDGVYS